MQVFANIATTPERKVSKQERVYWQFRVAESQRGVDTSPSFFTVRIFKEDDPQLAKGDFVKVTGRLLVDFYLSREGKPTGTLLILAFEAVKLAKHAAMPPEVKEPRAPSKDQSGKETVRVLVEEEAKQHWRNQDCC